MSGKADTTRDNAVRVVRAWRIRREGLLVTRGERQWTSDEMWDKIRRAYPTLSPEDQEYVYQEAAR